MTSPWSTPRAGCWHDAASVTTRPATSSSCSCSPRLATPPLTRSRWPSRPAAGCWWPACAPPAGVWTRSIPWPYPATATVTAWRAPSPTTPTQSSWQASCAPTRPRTGPCQQTPSSPRRSRCWPAPSRTRSASRQQLAMKLRSLLREFFPAALAAFHRKHVGLTAPEARSVLAATPTRPRRRA